VGRELAALIIVDGWACRTPRSINTQIQELHESYNRKIIFISSSIYPFLAALQRCVCIQKRASQVEAWRQSHNHHDSEQENKYQEDKDDKYSTNSRNAPTMYSSPSQHLGKTQRVHRSFFLKESF
jgi:hypothetical protein